MVSANGDVPEHAGLPVTRGPCAGSRLSTSHPALPAFSVGWGRRGQALSQSPHPWHEDQRGISHAPVGDSVTPGTWSTEQQAGTLGSHVQADTPPPTPAPQPEMHLFNEFSIGHTTDASRPLLRSQDAGRTKLASPNHLRMILVQLPRC